MARLIVLADEPRSFGSLDLAAEIITCDDLNIPLLENMKLWYTIIEFNTALKPYVFRHLFEKKSEFVFYLDPDMLLYQSLNAAICKIQDYSLILTPHIMRPLQDGMHPSDLSILKAGVYNLGFAAISNDSDGRALVQWWCQRLFAHSRVDIAGNFFTDQRWMDLAPAFVENSLILRDPGYNAAYWNLHERRIKQDSAGTWLSNDQPLVFFHFSGIDPEDPAVLSRHQDRFDVETLGAVAALCAAYRENVLANSWSEYRQVPYAYASFGDGRPILDAMRRWIRNAVDEGLLPTNEPLRLGSTYFDAEDTVRFANGGRLTRFAHQLWRDRPDLQSEFDLRSESGFTKYLAWLTEGSAEREGIPVQLVEAARALRDGKPIRALPARSALPPWTSLAIDAWHGAARDADQWFAGEVCFDIDGIVTRLQRQFALLWERRIDLQQAFPLRHWSELEAFHEWVLTEGVREKSVDVSLFTADYVEWLNSPSSIASNFDDVPIAHLTMLTRRCEHARENLQAWACFPSKPAARLEQAFWTAFLAPPVFGWPSAMTTSVRRYFNERSDVSLWGYSFSRGMLAIHTLRTDVQQSFDLHSDSGKWSYLCWLLLEGVCEYRLDVEELCPGIAEFMRRPWPRHPTLDVLAAFAYSQREDLQSAFKLDTRIDCLRMRDWARDELRSWLEGVGLDRLLPDARAADPLEASPLPHRCFLVLSGNWAESSGIGEDLRSSVAALQAVDFTDYVIVDLPSRAVIRPCGTCLPAGTVVWAKWNVIYRNADTALDDWRELRQIGIAVERVAAHWLWELERLPARWIHAFSFCDEVWASSGFVQASFEAEGRRPIRQIHHAVVAPPSPQDEIRRSFKLEEGATVFLFIFDFASYAERKNPLAAIRAFARAFPGGDERAQLLIKTRNAQLRSDLWDELVGSTEDLRVTLLNGHLSRDRVIDLIGCADAFVSLHRSEGFGRAPAEAMLLGKPVILTGYSGPTDFTDSDCACLVSFTLVAVQPGEYPADEDQRWAEADIEEAACHMRWVHEEPEAARAMGLRGQRRATEMLAPSKIGAQMLALLQTSDHPEPSVN